MENDAFLALVERALSDAAFAQQLRHDPARAPAAAGLTLLPADAELLQTLAARSGPDAAVFTRHLIEAALQRREQQPQ